MSILSDLQFRHCPLPCHSKAAGLRDGIELMTELFAERLKEAEQ